MNFTPLTDRERRALRDALTRNGDTAMLMDKETTFVGEADDLPADKEVVNAIKSVPTHYAR